MKKAKDNPENQSTDSSFESRLWAPFNHGWRPLFGRFNSLGFSFEWHEFKTDTEIDWSRSFHPESLEICLNLDGNGIIEASGGRLELKPRTYGFYTTGPQDGNGSALKAARLPGEKHKFLTVEIAFHFIRDQIGNSTGSLHPIVRRIVEGGNAECAVGAQDRLSTRHQKLLDNLKAPPVLAPAQELWYRSKAIEVISELLFENPEENQTLFCIRQQRLAQERVEKVKAILESRLADPPSLEELGKMVGCSHYYLSRTFSKEMSMTISQYLRQIRIEKAAELLSSGKFNVTEVALEVGYSSLSHFSHAFQQLTGCCPGLYPLKKPQK